MRLINKFSQILLIFIVTLVWQIFWINVSSLAANIPGNREILSSATLEDRINNLVQQDGRETIDLSNFQIDLSNKNIEFRDRFYQQLQTKFIRTSEPLALDLSQSVIAGEFRLSQLGIQTPLAEGTLSSLLTPLEQEKIRAYSRLLPQPGEEIPSVTVWRGLLKLNQTEFIDLVDFSNTLYLQTIQASKAIFRRPVDWSNSRFSREVNFDSAQFSQDINFAHSLFLNKVNFDQAQFKGITNFTNSSFQESLSFQKTNFIQLADFSKIQCLKNADFSQTRWRDRVIFSQSGFLDKVIFNNSTFEKAVAFRDAHFHSLIDFQDVSLLEQIDFSNTIFTKKARLNVAGLAFDSDNTKLIGATGVIGRVIAVPSLEGNETVLRNLIRNFRHLEQIPDANIIEYEREKLRLQQLTKQIINTPWQQIFRFNWLSKIWQWLGLNLLLLLGNYGTNFSLVFGVGIVAIAYFSLLFWFVDRYRRRLPQPIIPNKYETSCMVGSYTLFTTLGIINIFQATDRPWETLACLAVILLPLPAIFLIRLYQQGRYHNLLNLTYFVEDGSMRQFRLLLGRLPIMPRFPFFRDRYYPLLWDRRWNWLNYYDFSLNNLLRFGFNDIRLRDEHLPGIISVLVWYQWSLGVLYIILLLWTLSRTIPGLNLLIYF
jgi:hypothetical protein